MQSQTTVRLSGVPTVATVDRGIPAVRIGNLILRVHDAAAVRAIASLVLLLRANRGHLTHRAGAYRPTSTSTGTRAVVFIELVGDQPLSQLVKIRPEGSRSGHGEMSVTFGATLRLVVTDADSAEALDGALAHLLTFATIAYPGARSLEEEAYEIKRRWWMRDPATFKHP